ncbi:hypothetical protein, partial [Noviherbaspirillum aerium]|uniref:hypothetical protein n=1 Tax=Noviherbaspirillum aerium TaxID=2588497 RepID=UPI001CEF821E
LQQGTNLVKLFTSDIAWIILPAHSGSMSSQTRFGQKNIVHVLKGSFQVFQVHVLLRTENVRGEETCGFSLIYILQVASYSKYY